MTAGATLVNEKSYQGPRVLDSVCHYQNKISAADVSFTIKSGDLSAAIFPNSLLFKYRSMLFALKMSFSRETLLMYSFK